MRKAAFVVIVIAIIAAVLSGCGGTKVTGVPDTVATVNGEKISAASYLEDLNRRIGQDVLTNMIEQKIIIQWAKDTDVPVTEKQIEKQIDTLKRDGVYDDQVKTMGESGVKSEIEALQARINVAKKLYKPSDKDLAMIYSSMKDRYVHGARKQAALIINPDKKKLEEATKALKKDKDFDEVAGMYTDRRFMMRGTIKVWVDETKSSGLPPSLVEAAKDTKDGEVSKIFSIGQPGQPTQYAILKIVDEQPKSDLSEKDVKDELQNFAALQKAQSDPDFQKKLNEQKKKAKVEVNIDQYKNIVQTFKNPPEPMPMMGMPQQAPQ